MVTNALQHSGGREFTVKVHASPKAQHVLVEVHDDSSALPRTLAADDDAEGGRGMLLISQLAAACGAAPTKRGKRVWAVITLPEQSLTRRQLLLRPGRATRSIVGRLTRPRAPAGISRLPLPVSRQTLSRPDRQRSTQQ
jgi:hypothetical protein